MQQSEFRSTMDASQNNVNITFMPKFEAPNDQLQEVPVNTILRHHQPPPLYDSGVVNSNKVNVGLKRTRRCREVVPKEVAPPVMDHQNYNDQVNEEDRVFFESFPPGYRFCPTDEELIDHYLFKKLKNVPLPRNQIREVNIYLFNPDQIAARYPSINKNAWYFFTPRDKKYLHGSRPNRSAGAGFWKACGADKPIYDNKEAENKIIIGLKKALVYHRGRPPKGEKTNWLMHEFMLHKDHPHWDEIVNNTPTNSMKLNEFVLCKIYKRNDNSMKAAEEAEVKEVEVAGEVDAKLKASEKVEEVNEAGDLKNFAPPLLQNGGLHYSYPHYNPSIQYPYSSPAYHQNQLPPTSYHQNQLPPTSYHQNQLPPTSYQQNHYNYDLRASTFMAPSLPGYDSSSINYEQVSSNSLPGYDSSMNFEQVSSNLEEMDYFVMDDEFDNNAPSFANELASKLLNQSPAPAPASSKVA